MRTIPLRVVGALLLLVACLADRAGAHPGGHDGEDAPFGRVPVAAPRSKRGGGGTPVRLVSAPRGKAALADVGIAEAFAPFEKLGALETRRDDRWFFVEGGGIPDHPLMVGIRAWQQQVPLPQSYVGDNAWRIPLRPVPAKRPASARNRFLRGAIALAVNGIPIFNPLNNRGEDAYAIGELDDFGGHCGRADDYHYHIAPIHLEEQVGKGRPIAWALDGYPIYGYTEPDGSEVRGLDELNGHEDAAGNYHYHATKGYPYLNGGFHGEVKEVDGQVDPQPSARPVREALPPMRGATIVAFESIGETARRLTYEVGGKKGFVEYSSEPGGTTKFRFTDPQGRSTEQSFEPRGRRPGGGGGRKARRDEGSPGGPLKEGPRGGPARPRNPPANGGAGGDRVEPAEPRSIAVTSSAIGADGRLPVDHTCDGAGVSPPVSWEAGPAGTVEYALVLWHEAPDRLKTYWIVHGIPGDVVELPAGSTGVGTVGLNDKGRPEYDPMCSKGPGVKRYHVTVYALSARAGLPPRGATRDALLAAIAGTTLAEGTLSFDSERTRDE